VPTSNSAADAEGKNPNIAAAILLRAAVTMRYSPDFFFFFVFLILHIHTFTDK